MFSHETFRICNHLLELTDSFRPSKDVFNFNPLAIAETPASRIEFAYEDNIIKLLICIWQIINKVKYPYV